MGSPTTSSTPIIALLAALTVAGCVLPTGVGAGSDLTVSTLLANAVSGRVVSLKAGQGGISVPIAASRSGFFTVNAQGRGAGSVQVAITNGDRAALTSPIAFGPDIPEAASAAFEPRLRAMEAPLRRLKPAKRYQTAQAKGYALGDEESFWVIADSEGARPKELLVPAKASYVGEHCYVFVDKSANLSGLDARVQAMGKTFDAQIFPTDSRLFGNPVASGVNGDPKITLLVTPAVGNYGRDTTIGYFTVRDLFQPSDAPDVNLLQHSNRRLMLYMSSEVVAKGASADYLGTMAHEFQHLINASQRVFATGSEEVEDVWLDEGLAMYAMEANGYGLAGDGGVVFSHVQAFQEDPEAFSLTNWNANPDQSAYGAAYLYTTYLVDRFGEDILKKLVTSPSIGVANVQGVLGTYDTTFEAVFEDWTAANMFDHAGVTADPRFNYKSISMLGTYNGHRLRGMALSPVKVPNVGVVSLKPYSAQYFYVPKATPAAYNFALSSETAQRYGGWVVTP